MHMHLEGDVQIGMASYNDHQALQSSSQKAAPGGSKQHAAFLVHAAVAVTVHMHEPVL